MRNFKPNLVLQSLSCLHGYPVKYPLLTILMPICRFNNYENITFHCILFCVAIVYPGTAKEISMVK